MHRTAEAQALVVVAGVPGAGKTTLIDRAVDRTATVVLDTDDRRRAGRASRWRTVRVAGHYRRIVAAVLGRRDVPVVVHSRGTGRASRRLLTGLARLAGRSAHLVLLVVSEPEAVAGQVRRGRTIRAREMRSHTRRLARLLTDPNAVERAEGWASVAVLEREQAAAVTDLVAALGHSPGSSRPGLSPGADAGTMNPTKNRTAAIAATVLLSLGGGAYATAASTTGSSGRSGNPDESALTGDTAAKVRAAALEKVPGATILRVETDEGGVYEAHVRRADGTEAEVEVDERFAVTAVETRPAGGRGGPGGPGGRGGHVDTAALATTLGVTEAKLRSALEATRPAKGDRDAGRGDRAAAIAKALGEPEADVQAVLEANRPARGDRGPGAAKPDRTALIAALAKAFDVSTAKATTAVAAAEKAHRAQHDARDAAMATALAEELGLDVTKVTSALEAARPPRP